MRLERFIGRAIEVRTSCFMLSGRVLMWHINQKRQATLQNLLPFVLAEELLDEGLRIVRKPSMRQKLELLLPQPSLPSMTSIYSPYSSGAPASGENDDEDIKVVHRLLLRRVEPAVSSSRDEVEKAFTWLSIVQEAVRGVKRRAYL